MKRWLTAVLLPIVLIIAIPSLTNSSSKAAETKQVVEQKPYTITVYLKHVDLGSNRGTVTADPIQWYEGKAADKIFAEREPDAGIDGPPDGYYIVNDKEEQTEYPVAKDAQVLMQIYDRTGNPEDADIKWNEPITLEKFSKVFTHTDLIDLSGFPYHLTIANGEVVKIVQQYVP
ncbi:hypothetical protein ACFQ3W_24680 [Paenibacillus puldeungensis]|uniref:DUF4309 domain-containing protein n=1 Tax=Paenibacillus puldeungensis TaxID=696536 RepID=A0ABW3S5M1_9BACL